MKKVVKKAIALALSSVMVLGFAAFGGCFGGREEIAESEVTVYMPDGAPALAMAKLMSEDKADDGVTYRVVDASAIASKVTNEDMAKNADLCVMPINAAAKLHGESGKYTMLGAVTHGNLYMIKKVADGEEILTYTGENLAALIGKKVGVLQINNVPGLTFKAVLNKHGVAWRELTNTGEVAEDKVNLVALTDASAVASVDADYFVIAEPAATAQKKNGFSIVGDLQALYGGENGYPQAALIAKTELVENRADWLAEFVEKVDDSATWLVTASGVEIVSAISAHMEDEGMASSLKAPLLTSEVLARCSARFAYAADIQGETSAFLGDLIAVNANATKLPAAAFYWSYKK